MTCRRGEAVADGVAIPLTEEAVADPFSYDLSPTTSARLIFYYSARVLNIFETVLANQTFCGAKEYKL